MDNGKEKKFLGFDMRERRITDTPIFDTSRILAIMYTLGFFGMVWILMVDGIPLENKDAINQLIGALTIIQTGIVSFYFGGSKAGEAMQQKLASSKDRAETVLQEIAAAPTSNVLEVKDAHIQTDGDVNVIKEKKP